jgi:hypothetical protein
MNIPMPQNLEVIDPTARTFPASWRDAAIRLCYEGNEVRGESERVKSFIFAMKASSARR